MQSSSKVALFGGNSNPFEIKQLASIDLLQGEILVRVTCCTICGSDLHTFCGRRTGPIPAVLGHEIIGIVENWSGSTPTDYLGNQIQVGQRITWGLSASCNNCSFCKKGIPQKCESLFKYGHAKFDGRPTGGLADRCVLVPGTTIYPIPDHVPDEVACPANCATATVFAALRLVEEVSEIRGKRVLITGLGMLGLTACAACKSKGADRIVAIDTIADRRKLALDFGADETIGPDNLAPDQTNEFDIALEFSGAKSAIAECVSRLAIGGIVVLAGSVFPNGEVPVDPENIVRRILTIRGIHNYRSDDLADAIQFLESNQRKFPFAKLVSKKFGLHQIDDAFKMANSGTEIRVAVVPSIN